MKKQRAGNSCTGRFILEKNGHKLINCDICGYIHVVPMYNTKDLNRFYKNFSPDNTPSYIWSEKVLNAHKLTGKTGTVLDLACWDGTQLELFIRDGWSGTGVETNKTAARKARAKGIEVHQMSIEAFLNKYSRKRWDVVNLAYVLERIPKPAALLKALHKNVAKEGLIIAEVPNDFNPLQLAYIKEHRARPYWIALPEHLNYFDKESIKGLVEKTGWDIVHAESSFPMELFLLMGDNYIKNRDIGKRNFKKVIEAERSMRSYKQDLVSQIYAALYSCGIGRSITIYAKKG